MIIWAGHGYLVAVFVFVASLLMELASESVTHDSEYYQREGLPLAGALAIAAVLSLVVGLALRRGAAPGRKHTLFFIPMPVWGPLLLALAVGVYVTRTFDVAF
jgi:hypothetical protein